ncbi:TPR repeat-containing protein (plasmid) [Fischerella sp. NIES-4106]|nr:TPR repeat-containing protein [Fischerella sp. NIES-4106]
MDTANLEQAQVYYNQGLEHLKSGNLDGVIECFEQALKFNPNFAEVHNQIGMIQLQIQRFSQAIQLFDNAVMRGEGKNKGRLQLNIPIGPQINQEVSSLPLFLSQM